jgi:hypothetical protein
MNANFWHEKNELEEFFGVERMGLGFGVNHV